jgi:transcriptional regulator with XRE-family HTH domain
MVSKKEIGEKIRELRINNKLSQEQLGNLIGRSHATISDIERGKTDLGISDLFLIADRLKSSVPFILNIQTNPSTMVFQLNYTGNIAKSTISHDYNVDITENSKSVTI